MLDGARAQMNAALLEWEELLVEYRAAIAGKTELSRRELADLRRKVNAAYESFRDSLQAWRETWQAIPAGC